MLFDSFLFGWLQGCYPFLSQLSLQAWVLSSHVNPSFSMLCWYSSKCAFIWFSWFSNTILVLFHAFRFLGVAKIIIIDKKLLLLVTAIKKDDVSLHSSFINMKFLTCFCAQLCSGLEHIKMYTLCNSLHFIICVKWPIFTRGLGLKLVLRITRFGH